LVQKKFNRNVINREIEKNISAVQKKKKNIYIKKKKYGVMRD
jgi:hypothetical protein